AFWFGHGVVQVNVIVLILQCTRLGRKTRLMCRCTKGKPVRAWTAQGARNAASLDITPTESMWIQYSLAKLFENGVQK
ncbi:hypothetical protein NDU88_001164, partial [Pleurodeles waltl]